MSRSQKITIGAVTALFLILYFGVDIVSPKQRSREKSGLNNIETTSKANLIKEAFSTLDNQQKAYIEALNIEVDKSSGDTLKKIEALKSLSGAWFDLGHPSIAGALAEDIAIIEKSEETWSMTGTTFALCVKNAQNDKIKSYCSKKAINAFEKAISLNPENTSNRINLAICYVDNPPNDNPMQGILMLRELNTKYPENVSVLNQLARLALQTKQYEKAVERLLQALSIEPENINTICMLVEAYSGLGQSEKSLEFKAKCDK